MNRGDAVRRDSQPVRLHVAKVRVPLSAVIGAWLARRAGAGLWWLARHPVLVLALVIGVLAWRYTATHGPALLLASCTLVTSVLVTWRLRWPASFTRFVGLPLWGAWRSARVYRRWWQPAMVTSGLAVVMDGTEYLPRLRRVTSTGCVDVVRVRMLPGQTLEDWATAAPGLAQTFGAIECRVRTVPGRAHDLTLWLLVVDPLAGVVRPFQPADTSGEVDLSALPVALGEDGLLYRLRLLGTHLLVVGSTGSGKGSVLWSLLAALAPAIRDRLVQVWAIDPKGGMEFAPGAALFTRFVHGDHPDAAPGEPFELGFARVLEDAVAVMRTRQARLRGVARLHTPTVVEPLIVVLVDELASLTAYVSDRDAKRRIATALGLLLSQGRAVGVTVVGALQDPRKDILPLRDLFPTRVALRLTEAEQVGLVLGRGARDRGARCDTIPERSPGVGYVGLDGVAEPVRVRFTHVTDAHMADLAHRYAPTPDLTVVRDDDGVAA